MPDIGSLQATDHESLPALSTEPAPPTSTGAHNKFSYTKNWGEVSNTLRKKLSKRLSALKESDDNSGDEEHAYRSDRSQVDGARSPPDSLFSGRSDRVGSPHDRSPDLLLGADGLSSVRHSRAAIWQKISSASVVVAPTAGDRSRARFNRVGTTFQGMYVAPERPHVDNAGVGSQSPRTDSVSPEREYRSLAAFITRSATPERLRARSSTPGGRAETPERRASAQASPRISGSLANGYHGLRSQGEDSEITSKLSPRSIAASGNVSTENENENTSVTENGKDGHVISGSTAADQLSDDLDDEDDENCLACQSEKSESQQCHEKPAIEEVSTHSNTSSYPSPGISTRNTADDTCSSGSSSSSRKNSSKSIDCKNDEGVVSSSRRTAAAGIISGSSSSSRKNSSKSIDCKNDEGVVSSSRMSRTLTHFVEVTNVEDGNKRITYVENGITVEPVVVSKTKDKHGRKTRTKTAVPKVMKEEKDGSSLNSLDSEGMQSLSSSKSKPRQSPSSPDTGRVPGSVTPSPNSVSETQGSPKSDVSRIAAESGDSSTKAGWPLEPGPHTGAIPKRRDMYGTRVVKFPKDRSRGQGGGSPPTEPTDDHQRLPSDCSEKEISPHSLSEIAVEISGHDDPSEPRNGHDEPTEVNGTERGQSLADAAKTQRVSVAKRQALYESIGEVNAARRTTVESKPDPPPPPPARPAVMPSPPAPTAASIAATPTDSSVSDEPTSGGTSSVADSDTSGERRNYRLRRSALEALPVRVPAVRELVSSRFKEAEVSDTRRLNVRTRF